MFYLTVLSFCSHRPQLAKMVALYPFVCEEITPAVSLFIRLGSLRKRPLRLLLQSQPLPLISDCEEDRDAGVGCDN
jgi:hypothetical protein